MAQKNVANSSYNAESLPYSATTVNKTCTKNSLLIMFQIQYELRT